MRHLTKHQQKGVVERDSTSAALYSHVPLTPSMRVYVLLALRRLTQTRRARVEEC